MPKARSSRMLSVVGLLALVGALLAACTPTPLADPGTEPPLNPASTTQWRERLGVVATTLDERELTKIKELGVRWVRFSWKQGWGADGNWTARDAYVAKAKSLGLKTAITCERADRTYDSVTIPLFVTWCARWVDAGVDAIEVGNEWNWEWMTGTGKVSRAAAITLKTANAIRAKSKAVKIVTNGWAPVVPDAAANTQAMFTKQPDLRWRVQGVGLHPYTNTGPPYYGVTLEDPFPKLETMMRGVAAAAPRQEIWFTEFGSPSKIDGNGEYTEWSQAVQLKRYFNAITKWRKAGLKFGVFFVYAMTENKYIGSAGLHYATADGMPGKAKLATVTLKDQLSQPW